MTPWLVVLPRLRAQRSDHLHYKRVSVGANTAAAAAAEVKSGIRNGIEAAAANFDLAQPP